MNDHDIITIADARACGYCVKGVRRWLKGRGLDDRSFFKNGIEYRHVKGFNDAMVESIVRMKDGKNG